MERAKKGCKPGRLVRGRCSYIGRLSFDPGHNAPVPRISAAGHADTERGRNRNWNSIGDGRQPFLLVSNELSSDSTAREPNDQVHSKPKDSVGPTAVDGRDVKLGKFGMLGLNQYADQIFIDLDFRCRGATVHVEILKEILRPK